MSVFIGVIVAILTIVVALLAFGNNLVSVLVSVLSFIPTSLLSVIQVALLVILAFVILFGIVKVVLDLI